MIGFMVIGAPRSGTAWCSNWLTTERTLCLHDALFEHDLESLDSLRCDRTLGLADTGIWAFPDFLAKHPAKKVILHRDPYEVDASLKRAGLPEVGLTALAALQKIEGLHVDWQVLFDAPALIHQWLFGTYHHDKVRHAALRKLNVQVDFEKVDPDPTVCRRLIERMQADQR
jgi:hypothetical protein